MYPFIQAQRQQIEYASKMSALGEMAGDIAHEINNPISIIQLKAEQLLALGESNELERESLLESVRTIGKALKTTYGAPAKTFLK